MSDATEIHGGVTDGDLSGGKGYKDGPGRKWYYQRIAAMFAMAMMALWPILLYVNPDLEHMTTTWFTAWTAVLMTWLGGTAVSFARR